MATSRTQHRKMSLTTISSLVICAAEFDRKYTNGDRPVSADDPFFTALAQQSKRQSVEGELTRHMTAFVLNVVRLVEKVQKKQLSLHKLQEVFIAFRGWFIQNRQPNGEQEWQHLLECCRKNPGCRLCFGVVAALCNPASFMFKDSIERAFQGAAAAAAAAAGGSNSVVQSRQQCFQKPNRAYTVNPAAVPVLPVTSAGLRVAQQPYVSFPVYYGLPLTTINNYRFDGATINQCYTQPFESQVVQRLDNLATEVVKINKNLGDVKNTLDGVEDKVDTYNILINGECTDTV